MLPARRGRRHGAFKPHSHCDRKEGPGEVLRHFCARFCALREALPRKPDKGSRSQFGLISETMLAEPRSGSLAQCFRALLAARAV
jgi:hypothetical protein